LGIMSAPQFCAAQTASGTGTTTASTPVATATAEPPLTDREKAMLDLIKQLQERVTKLETQAAVVAAGPTPLKDITRDPETGVPREKSGEVKPDKKEEKVSLGQYTPN